MPKANNLTGRIFGEWVVLKQAPTRRALNGFTRVYWLCKCNMCGNCYEVFSTSLTSGKSTACKHCGSTKDLRNKIFGDWHVIKLARRHKRPSGKVFVYWVCKCKLCNRIYEVSSSCLTGGLSKRCRPCGHRKIFTEGLGTRNRVWFSYLEGARIRNITFKLSKKMFLDLCDGDCVYCGDPPNMTEKSRHGMGNYLHNGIDRVDNTKGYLKENCVTCCKICNQMKHALGKEAFLTHIAKIYSRSICDSGHTVEIHSILDSPVSPSSHIAGERIPDYEYI
jgi:hypothetical protein